MTKTIEMEDSDRAMAAIAIRGHDFLDELDARVDEKIASNPKAAAIVTGQLENEVFLAARAGYRYVFIAFGNLVTPLEWTTAHELIYRAINTLTDGGSLVTRMDSRPIFPED